MLSVPGNPAGMGLLLGPLRATTAVDLQGVPGKTFIALLALPLVAGPTETSPVIFAAHRSSGIAHFLITAAGIVLLSPTDSQGVLRLSPWVADKISATGITIFTRLMRLILPAIAVEFIANSIKGLFPVGA